MRLAMPSGNQEPRRDPELKRKAWLAVFLGGCRTADLESVGITMVGQEQLESSPLCQHSDNETETKRECSVVIPDDWQLTSQQQAFIELFAEDDQPKQ
jgi:hypothetical protein